MPRVVPGRLVIQMLAHLLREVQRPERMVRRAFHCPAFVVVGCDSLDNIYCRTIIIDKTTRQSITIATAIHGTTSHLRFGTSISHRSGAAVPFRDAATWPEP